MLLCHGGIMKTKAMDKPLVWGTYWAALVHDYEHEGLNNDFLIKTAHPLAITYSDHSPLEHHHAAAATRVFLEPECQYITVRHHTCIARGCICMHHSSAHQCICSTSSEPHATHCRTHRSLVSSFKPESKGTIYSHKTVLQRSSQVYARSSNLHSG